VRSAAALITILVFSLAAGGCGRRPSSGKSASNTTDAASDKEFHVGVVLDVGGRGDRGINDSALLGVEQARNQLDAKVDVLEPKSPAGRDSCLQTLAARKDLDLIITVGAAFTDAINRIAKQFPERRFACVDYRLPGGRAGADLKAGDLPFNVRALLFREEEGCYIAGALAGWSTRTGRIGYLGSVQDPVEHRLEKAFEGGVRSANARAEVGPKYVGTSPETARDAASAKAQALSLYDAGADIILEHTGMARAGVYQAATDRHHYVIGTDADQSSLAPGLVMTSIVKHVDRAVFQMMGATRDGNFQGGVTSMGFLTGGVELILNDDNQDLVPDDIRSRLESLRRDIIGHQIQIPTGDESTPDMSSSLPN